MPLKTINYIEQRFTTNTLSPAIICFLKRKQSEINSSLFHFPWSTTRTQTIICWNPFSLLTRVCSLDSRPLEPTRMERVQHMTRSAIRRASNIEVNPQTKRNLQDLIINFSLILICLLLIYIIVLLMWQPAKILDSFGELNLLLMMWQVSICWNVCTFLSLFTFVATIYLTF